METQKPNLEHKIKSSLNIAEQKGNKVILHPERFKYEDTPIKPRESIEKVEVLGKVMSPDEIISYPQVDRDRNISKVSLTEKKITSYTPTVMGKVNLALFDRFLNDDLLFSRHLDLLEGKINIKKYKNGELVEEINQYDFPAVAKALDMAYRIKGYYGKPMEINVSPEQINTVNNVNINNLKDNEIDDLLNKIVLAKNKK